MHQNGSVDANRSIDAFSIITNTIIMDRALVCLGDDNVIDIFPVKLNWNNSKICSSTKDFICSRLAWLVVPFKGYLMISAEPSWSSHFSFFVRQAFFNGFQTIPEFATLRLFAAWAKCVFDAFNLKETEKKSFYHILITEFQINKRYDAVCIWSLLCLTQGAPCLHSLSLACLIGVLEKDSA